MTLKEFYSQIGEDYEQAIARIPKEKSLIRFLKRLSEDNDFAKLKESVEAKAYKEVFANSHNLKGVFANLSLDKLAAATSRLCECVRGGEPSGDMEALLCEAAGMYKEIDEAIQMLED